MGQPPNVVVLIFDTLRPDYLSCYDGDIHTPAFDTIAEMGVTFESAFAAGPGTSISHAALYTGQYPSETGVTGQYITMPEDPVIAQWLSDTGYTTFGITGPAKMGSEWGYDRGFDELFEPHFEHPDPTSLVNIPKALTDSRYRKYFLRKIIHGGHDRARFKFDLLKDRIASFDQPFFALSNSTAVHYPYDPPRPYLMEATLSFSRPRFFFLEFLLDNLGATNNEEIRLDRVFNVQSADGIAKYLADPSYLNSAEEELLRDWYSACVSYLDDELDRFLEYYRSELVDDTILIVTSDHGEYLAEYGMVGHSYGLYDEVMQVPLILTGPGLPSGKRRSDLTSLVDIFDTICDLCELEPPSSTSGQSLFGGEDRDAVFMEYGERDASVFAAKSVHSAHMDDDQIREFTTGRKAIRTPNYRFELTSHGSEHLFELPEQFKEDNVSREKVRQLRQRLTDTLSPEFGQWPETLTEVIGISEDVAKNLRELGYIE